MESASLAGLVPGARCCTLDQAGDEAVAVLAAEHEFDPMPGPFGLQSFLPPHPPPSTTKGGCSQGWLWLVPRPGDALSGPPAKAGELLRPSQPPPEPPWAGGAQPEGDGGDTGHLWQVPVPPQEPQLSFSSAETHQEEVRQQERKICQRRREGEKTFPSRGGPGRFHPPSQLSNTRCGSGTCHKFSRRGKARAELLSACPQMY